MPPVSAFINWSSGKDAALSLYRIRQENRYEVRYLFTTLNAANRRVSMHGVREALLKEQSRQLNIPLRIMALPENADLGNYDHLMKEQLAFFVDKDIKRAIYGDIFLEDLRTFREKQLSRQGMKAVFPLWKKDTRLLIKTFLDTGFKAVITCVDAQKLDKSFVGRVIDETLLAALPEGVDPCGENGEFHSFVFDGPLFDHPVAFDMGEVVEKEYSESSGTTSWSHRFYFCDLVEKASSMSSGSRY